MSQNSSFVMRVKTLNVSCVNVYTKIFTNQKNSQEFNTFDFASFLNCKFRVECRFQAM